MNSNKTQWRYKTSDSLYVQDIVSTYVLEKINCWVTNLSLLQFWINARNSKELNTRMHFALQPCIHCHCMSYGSRNILLIHTLPWKILNSTNKRELHIRLLSSGFLSDDSSSPIILFAWLLGCTHTRSINTHCRSFLASICGRFFCN